MPDQLALTSFVEDETIYPRASVLQTNIASIAEALRAGQAMPPVVADARTHKVIDGVHRLRAYRAVFGDSTLVPVQLKHYRNRAEMLRDAIALNVGHATNLTRWDLMRCVDLGEAVGLPLDSVAKLVHWRPERLAKYRETRMTDTLDGRRLALKASIRHRLGQPLTPAQEDANARLSGMSAGFHVNQLLTLLGAGLMPDDPHTVDQLVHLAQVIGTWAEQHQPTNEQETTDGSS